ncbi:serine threonine protein kinase CMGC group [Umbelopsis nana]
MTTVATRRRKRSPNTDWKADFYRNGYPSEVIVIEDSPTPTHDQRQNSTSNSNAQQLNHASAYTTPPAASTRSKRPRRKVTSAYQQQLPQTSQISYPVLTPVASLVGNFTQPTAKRRRKENGETAVYPEASHRQEHVYRPTSTADTMSASYDDKDGHYIIIPNEDLTTRYKMIRLLGQGTFGKVVECWDRVRRRYCAVKVIRAVPKYRDASKIEIRVLNTLKENDPLNLNKCIHLLEWFDFRNHICMVFELLGQSVFDFLKENEFHPFPAHHIQHFARQLLTSVAFVHELKLIHTDLKPENILLVNNEYRLVPCRPSKRSGSKVQRLLVNTEIRLIDFGSATFEHDYHSSVVSTRHYRAPEIILGMGWSYPCDIWSIGCILVEFFTGDALFQTHDNLEHLAMMEVVLGKIPERTLRQARHTQKYFESGRLNYPNDETTKQSRKYVKAMRPLQEIIPPSSNLNRHLLELLQRLLMYDPADRISAHEALKHPFFHVQLDENGREITH